MIKRDKGMDKYKINNIYIIDCIDKREAQSKGAKSLYDDIVSKVKYVDSNVETGYFLINSKKQFLETLIAIEKKEIENKNVLVHVYLHGSEEGLFANDNKLITWDEIKDITRKINIKTGNKLFLVLANCYGSYFESKPDLSKKAPFNSIISSRYEEKTENIYNLFENFYNSLVLEQDDIVKVYLKAKKESNFYFKNVNTIIQTIGEKNNISNCVLDNLIKDYRFNE